MKASAQKQEQSAPTPGIVSVGNIAAVQPSGIVNKNLHATDADMAKFVAQIRQGKPTGKIFPAKLSEMIFSTAQRVAIAEARKFHRVESMKSQKSIAKLFGHKDTIVLGHRTNHDGNKGRASYALRSAFLGKDGKFSPDKLARHVEGPKVKGAPAVPATA